MKKTTFRVKLFEGATNLCHTLVVMAAKSNGNTEKLSFPLLVQCAKTMNLSRDTQVEQIGEHLLHIDIKDGEEYKTVCTIEEIEVFEVSTPEFETADDLEGLFERGVGMGDN